MVNLKPFLAICFFKNQQIEALENITLSKALLFYSIVAMAIQINFHGALVASIISSLEIFLTLTFLGFLVFSYNLIDEFVLLNCVVTICTGFIASLSIPFVLMLYLVKGKLAIFLYYSIVALIIWALMVVKSIFATLLEISKMRSFLLTLSYFVIAYIMPALLKIIML